MREFADNAHWLVLIIAGAALFFLPNFIANLRCAQAYPSIAALYIFLFVPLILSILSPKMLVGVVVLWTMTLASAFLSPRMERNRFKEMIKAGRRNLFLGP